MGPHIYAKHRGTLYHFDATNLALLFFLVGFNFFDIFLCCLSGAFGRPSDRSPPVYWHVSGRMESWLVLNSLCSCWFWDTKSSGQLELLRPTPCYCLWSRRWKPPWCCKCEVTGYHIGVKLAAVHRDKWHNQGWNFECFRRRRSCTPLQSRPFWCIYFGHLGRRRCRGAPCFAIPLGSQRYELSCYPLGISICMESLRMKQAKTVSLLPGGHSVQFWSIEPECDSAFLWFSLSTLQHSRSQRGGINGDEWKSSHV